MVVEQFYFFGKEKTQQIFYNAYYFRNNSNSKLESLYKIKMFIFKSYSTEGLHVTAS